ncbi:peptidoglycan recognition protein family protein [Lentilactobacillus kosonis]|uniref:Bifunctional autolysin Atl: N-acetylmuramoyl-L-alanine amidase, endo-beta-N-acetylglucosaminidase n=1 Tax=Lentilactobacillus kosonis TaxID=2810561 RepID=A0A401FMF2_9LACO|nr:N-acetylmuramoyl-L-alanine amidase [Lentilactobacillus kosonis]GAY73523.1 bifunctional autolysin Atl: N-acetylmuramoyl-L-alanine amidase, endo-beta-N-acetylglucosaminidase [Lentilactobacillus kosonis]
MKKKIFKTICTLSFAALGLIASSGAQSAHAESVNNYIANNNIGHAKITSAVWSGFPKNSYRHSGRPEGVVVHETANPSSTIYNEIAYMKRNYNAAFVHSFVDSSRIINIANTKYLAWGAGPIANARFVQFEQVRVHSKTAFAKEMANSAYYTAYLLKQYGLKPNDAAYDGKGTVWSHDAVSRYLGGTDHTDPKAYFASAGKTYFGTSYTFAQFYQLVKTNYNNLTSSAHTATDSYDKVSYKSANDTASLSKNYKSYRLYNHVKNSRANVKSYSWNSVSAKNGKKVYIDNIARKDSGKYAWYRIRFAKSSTAKKYWVYEKALNVTADNTEDITNEDVATVSQYTNSNVTSSAVSDSSTSESANSSSDNSANASANSTSTSIDSSN